MPRRARPLAARPAPRLASSPMTSTSPRPGTRTDDSADTPRQDREFDLILVGATGFVGKLTAAHLARSAPSDMRIALAGRSEDKLSKVRETLPEAAADWPLVTVDTLDEVAVRRLARRTRAVVTTVGPYAEYGRHLLGACAAAGTHYADLTGEVLFVRDMIDRHHATAQGTGARIVTSCGFDSVPSDLGVYLTAQRAAEDGEGTLEETVLHVRSMRGGFSGGTVDSMRRQFAEMGQDKERAAIVADPFGLSPDRDAEPDRHDADRPASGGGADKKQAAEGVRGRVRRLASASPVRRAGGSGTWQAPFFMAAYNTRIVRRSNALTDWSYGRGFRYSEVSDTGSGPRGAVTAGVMTGALAGMATGMRFSPTRALLDRALPAPGEGPSEEDMARGRFVMEVEATTTTGARYITRVAAEKDPGYTGTAVMLGESALALAAEDTALPERAGVLTPATGLGDALVERLRAQGFTLTTERRADR